MSNGHIQNLIPGNCLVDIFTESNAFNILSAIIINCVCVSFFFFFSFSVHITRFCYLRSNWKLFECEICWRSLFFFSFVYSIVLFRVNFHKVIKFPVRFQYYFKKWALKLQNFAIRSNSLFSIHFLLLISSSSFFSSFLWTSHSSFCLNDSFLMFFLFKRINLRLFHLLNICAKKKEEKKTNWLPILWLFSFTSLSSFQWFYCKYDNKHLNVYVIFNEIRLDFVILVSLFNFSDFLFFSYFFPILFHQLIIYWISIYGFRPIEAQKWKQYQRAVNASPKKK